MPLPQHTLPIVGIDYPNKVGPTRRFELAMCTPGEELDLVPEPDNPADPSAVAVYSCRGYQLGYLPADRCGRISAMINQGRVVTAIYQGMDQLRGYARIAYDSDTPILPKAITKLEEPRDFWPDEIWLDD